MRIFVTLAIFVSISNYFADSSAIRDSVVLLQRFQEVEDEIEKEETRVISPENALSVKNEARDLLDKRTTYATSEEWLVLQVSLFGLVAYEFNTKLSKVVYSAQLNERVRYSNNEVLKFDDVTHIVFNANYGSSGKFICGTAGKYFVSFTIRSDSMTKSDRDIEGQIVKQTFDPTCFCYRTTVIASAKAKNQEEDGDTRGGQYVSADVSATAIVQLEAIEMLFVRAGSGGSPRVDAGDITIFKFRE